MSSEKGGDKEKRKEQKSSFRAVKNRWNDALTLTRPKLAGHLKKGQTEYNYTSFESKIIVLIFSMETLYKFLIAWFCSSSLPPPVDKAARNSSTASSHCFCTAYAHAKL